MHYSVIRGIRSHMELVHIQISLCMLYVGLRHLVPSRSTISIHIFTILHIIPFRWRCDWPIHLPVLLLLFLYLGRDRGVQGGGEAVRRHRGPALATGAQTGKMLYLWSSVCLLYLIILYMLRYMISFLSHVCVCILGCVATGDWGS